MRLWTRAPTEGLGTRDTRCTTAGVGSEKCCAVRRRRDDADLVVKATTRSGALLIGKVVRRSRGDWWRQRKGRNCGGKDRWDITIGGLVRLCARGVMRIMMRRSGKRDGLDVSLKDGGRRGVH